MARLIIAPHCDDEALGCGGLLRKYREECGVLVLARPSSVRRQEFWAAKELLGYKTALFEDLPDAHIGDDMAGLVKAIDRVLAIYQPTHLYLPYPSMHQDHIAAYEAGIRSARLSMNECHWFTPNVLVYDVAAYDLQLYPTDLRWNVFESLSEREADCKAEAVGCYNSEMVTGPHPANGIKESARTLGASRRVDFAEAYALVRQVVA